MCNNTRSWLFLHTFVKFFYMLLQLNVYMFNSIANT
jgi:hypothetical protein